MKGEVKRRGGRRDDGRRAKETKAGRREEDERPFTSAVPPARVSLESSNSTLLFIVYPIIVLRATVTLSDYPKGKPLILGSHGPNSLNIGSHGPI